jgi:hypothetical protein
MLKDLVEKMGKAEVAVLVLLSSHTATPTDRG